MMKTALIPCSDDVLHIDLETYSGEDISKSGLYKYVESPDFEILLIAWARNNAPVQVTDWRYCPEDVIADILDPAIKKCAHNAAFERACLGKALGLYQPPENWYDTMVMAQMNGLPAALECCGAALKLEQQKLKEGAALIRYFCKPCKPRETNGGRTRNLPEHAIEKWTTFKTYCKRDVEVERHLFELLYQAIPVSETEEKIRCLDARINERGVGVDMKFVKSAIAVDETVKANYTKELCTLTGIENPQSVAQLKAYLSGVGITTETVNKKAIEELKAKAEKAVTRRVLELRTFLGKTSTAKYQAIERSVCSDGRIRGLLQYYGASRTGRFAGRLVQLQNLPQNHLPEIAGVRELVKNRDTEALSMVFDSIPDVLSQLIRTAIVAKEGYTFLVADYHAIEAVCIAFLAGENWRLKVFETHGKIYEASYSQAFGVPFESVKKGSSERQKGKIMELALGYGGGGRALLAFGADKLGLNSVELDELVKKWRTASPKITKFWRDCEKAAKTAIENPGKTYKTPQGLQYKRGARQLFCVLPSGRVLSYWNARIEEDQIVFMAQNQMTRKWEKTGTWGGKLVENCVQAYARDVLAEALLRLDFAGYKICFHVHDEIIAEMPIGSHWEDMAKIMDVEPEWAPGLSKYLHADGFETPFYKKD